MAGFWTIVVPFLIDALFLLTGGILLDVTQWPKRRAFLHRIAAQVIAMLFGSIMLTIGSQFLEDFTGLTYLPFDPQMEHSIEFLLLTTTITLIIRTCYIIHQWISAISRLNA